MTRHTSRDTARQRWHDAGNEYQSKLATRSLLSGMAQEIDKIRAERVAEGARRPRPKQQ